jgi:multicomponent Na+:H+ antiporter subunit D
MSLINHIPALQVLIPFFSALFCALTFHKFTSWLIATIAIMTNLIIAFYGGWSLENAQPYYFGNWQAPIGIEYRLDYLNQPIIVYINGVMLFFLLFGKELINKTITKYIDDKKHHMFYSLLLFAHAGYLGVLSTNDLFNFYVFIEISSLATYGLISKGKNPKALIGAFDYLMLGTIGATLILISIGFFFAITGSLNITDISNILQVNYGTNVAGTPKLNLLIIAIVFFLTGAILKMAFFPLHFWMMRAYSATAPFVLTYIAAISSLLGIYMIMRFLYFTVEVNLVYIPFSLLLRGMAIITLIICSYLAWKSRNIKKIIIYSTALQIGYAFLLLSIWPAKALLFQLLIIDSINKIGLFTLLAHIENKTNNLDIYLIKQIKDSPWFKILAAFIILYSASLPLTSMFIIKIKIFELLIRQNLLIEFIIVIIASVFGILYHLKLAKAIFFAKEENGVIQIETNLLGLFAIVTLHIFTLLYMHEIVEMIGYHTSLSIG